MCVYTYVYLHICTYVCIYEPHNAYIYIYTRTYICTYICIWIYIHEPQNTPLDIWTSASQSPARQQVLICRAFVWTIGSVDQIADFFCMKYRSVLIRCRALLIRCRALLIEYMALWVRYCVLLMALLIELGWQAVGLADSEMHWHWRLFWWSTWLFWSRIGLFWWALFGRIELASGQIRALWEMLTLKAALKEYMALLVTCRALLMGSFWSEWTVLSKRCWHRGLFWWSIWLFW